MLKPNAEEVFAVNQVNHVNHVIETLQNRCSLRRYKEMMVSTAHKEVILKSMMRAPSAGNMMLYSVISIERQETKDILSRTCDNQPFIAKAPWILVLVADMQRWFDYYRLCDVPRYCAEHNLPYYQNPNLGDLFISVSDTLIAAQNAVIAAESLGIGSCYIGDIMENYETHRELFDLPDFAFPVAMLCLGYYPDDQKLEPRSLRPRFGQQYIVFDEKYHRLDDSELRAMFSEREKTVPQPGGNNPYHADNFGQLMYARKTGAPFFQEMHRSLQVAMQHWLGKK
jgi:FMN reductase (NADPH)